MQVVKRKMDSLDRAYKNINQKQPKVSVLTPTLNRLSLLKEAAASVLNQSFKDFEYIISDNCSSDGTEKWARELVKKDKRVRYYRNKKNIGPWNNWNKVLSYAGGKYITYLMDDDVLYPEFIEKMVKIFDKKEKIGIASVNYFPIYRFKDKGHPSVLFYYRLYKSNKEVKGVNCIKNFMLSCWLVGLPSGVFIRKKCFNELGNFDEVGQDPEMWLRICSRYN